MFIIVCWSTFRMAAADPLDNFNIYVISEFSFSFKLRFSGFILR
jgi:hypothetical protein